MTNTSVKEKVLILEPYNILDVNFDNTSTYHTYN